MKNATKWLGLMLAMTMMASTAGAVTWDELEAQVRGLYQAGRYQDAEGPARQMVSVAEQAFGANHEKTAISLSALASIYEKTGREAEAGPLYERALVIWQKNLPANDPYLAVPLSHLTEIHIAQKNWEAVERAYLQLIDVRTAQWGPDDSRLAPLLTGLADALAANGKDERAAEFYGQALRLLEAELGPVDPRVGELLDKMGDAYRRRGRTADAARCYERVAVIREANAGMESADTAAALVKMARAQAEAGNFGSCEKDIMRAIAIVKKIYGPKHYLIGSYEADLGRVYALQDRAAAADAMYDQAMDHLLASVGPNSLEVARLLEMKADLADSQGDKRGAKQLRKQAEEIRRKHEANSSTKD